MSEFDKYHEIEYEASPLPGVGRPRPITQKIRQPENDPIRELFVEMRDIARNIRSHYTERRFNELSKKIRGFASNINLQEVVHRFDDSADSVYASEIFHRQAIFMKDFSDNFSGCAAFSHYMPYYQHMGYEQLRTFFTWRTKVRMGQVEETSRAYLLIYIFELIGNIGVSSPAEGLEKLLFFWRECRKFTDSLDMNMARWLKDYFVIYQTHENFSDFVSFCDLQELFPGHNPDEKKRILDISTFDIKKSMFYTPENEELLMGCTEYVLEKVLQLYKKNGLDFLRCLLEPKTATKFWRPFEGALFYAAHEPSERNVLVENDIFQFSDGKWSASEAKTDCIGRRLLEYIQKQTESSLRELCKYKPKTKAEIKGRIHWSVKTLEKNGICLKSFVIDATKGFYYYFKKEDVTFDEASLEQIRKEAREIQERLIVVDTEDSAVDVTPYDNKLHTPGVDVTLCAHAPQTSGVDVNPLANASQDARRVTSTPCESQISEGFFTVSEKEALTAVLINNIDIRTFAAGCGIMPEVLVDGINEKALELIGDNLFDEDLHIYEDYFLQAKEWFK